MASTTPVLVSGTGELGHLIEDRRNGFLIRQRTPAALAAQILDVAARPDLAAIGQRGRRTARHFDLEATVQRYETLYQSLIK